VGREKTITEAWCEGNKISLIRKENHIGFGGLDEEGI